MVYGAYSVYSARTLVGFFFYPTRVAVNFRDGAACGAVGIVAPGARQWFYTAS